MARLSEVEWLLNDLCVRLGFCLPPAAARRLIQSPPADADAFAEAVFEAEGMPQPAVHHSDLHRRVRALIAEHMSRWP
ncbi:hypothetical protein BJY16_007270 [Actinoplanes octamycinicus]|uniref:Uncharacterized protein n=1 Tax=Actinoplanes octamycinicus TaxID=135948 RepID=A0A7W7H4G0_9ACTN|nr:hypothetical protein [Actinoplanes octamycinicus]MBB4743811.1 hypothetical protein [Actinoplanes octamycinicus]GIE58439.1 hypothetical protein Aoc01nite_38410 [Actinoplanes octamycinicus]